MSISNAYKSIYGAKTVAVVKSYLLIIRGNQAVKHNQEFITLLPFEKDSISIAG